LSRISLIVSFDKNFPKGYSLDAEHTPHISVFGGYFYTSNLDKTYAAVEKVLASEKVLSWKMKAFKYYYIPLKEIGLGGILVEPTAEIIRLQKKLIDALSRQMESRCQDRRTHPPIPFGQSDCDFWRRSAVRQDLMARDPSMLGLAPSLGA
jgi:hypothetical protein